ncbi:MAG: hypothetical protein ACKOXF_04930, partial [Chitinophagaceae bacterium]
MKKQPAKALKQHINTYYQNLRLQNRALHNPGWPESRCSSKPFAYQLYQIIRRNASLELNVFDCILAVLSIYATWLEVKKEMACWNIWI